MTNNILRFWQNIGSDDPLEPLFTAAPILMHSIDAKGVLIKVSRFWAQKLGYSSEELVGRKSVEFLTEESRKYATDIVLPEFFRTGSIYNIAYDFVRKDGKVLPVLMSAIAQYDEADGYVRSLAIMFDNSEAKRVAAELEQKQRMDAIGGLVGGVAHDFNNLLAVVQGNLEFLERDPDDADRTEFIESALEAAKRGGALTQQLLTYGRKARLSPVVIDLNDTVTRADRLVRRLFPANVRMETVTGGGLWKANIDPALLETALLNILNNARDAMPDGGRLTMETRNVRIDADYVETRDEEISPGRYVMLAVSDTGEGMDNDKLKRVFEPFYSTKPVGKGTGLGLSMVFGFMRQSKGTIRAYSEPGVGSTFKLYFPVAETDAEDDTSDQIMSRVGVSGKTVLLVEDEEKVRRVLARQLQTENLKVIEASSGDAAYQELVTGLNPDLLITDIVMPGSLQGPELAEKARKLMPDLCVLFISGYPTEAAIHGNGIKPRDRHLIKPTSEKQLIRNVLELLCDQDSPG
ncbi:MAG: ATP-binding protein [Pseudomonadota bacterium]